MNVLSSVWKWGIFAGLMGSSRQGIDITYLKRAKNNLIALNILVSFVVIGKDVVDKNWIIQKGDIKL